MLNKAEAILRKYFSGRTLNETEFSFLMFHIDDLEGKVGTLRDGTIVVARLGSTT